VIILNKEEILIYETNPCEDCEYARAFCDADFEYCQIHGAPTKEPYPHILDERNCLNQ
jgi:hypothetical protein